MTIRTLSLTGLDAVDIDAMLAQLAPVAGPLRGARILVTGATGWFGTWLLDALVALDRARRLGLRIVAVSRTPEAFATKHPALYRASQIEWIRADVRHPFDVGGVVTHVIHAATDASARLNAEEPRRMLDTIVAGTGNVLHVAAGHADVRVLLISSGAVYGTRPQPLAGWSEDQVVEPTAIDADNAYAVGKREAERMALAWHAAGRGTVTIARCFSFTGPHMPFDAHFAVGNFIRDALERNAIAIQGDGRPLRSYLYMSDLVVWLLAILMRGESGRSYNVGSDDALSIAELARRCAASAGRGVDVVVEGRPGEGRDYVPSVDRAVRELDVAVRVPLDLAIARTVAWRARSIATAAAS